MEIGLYENRKENSREYIGLKVIAPPRQKKKKQQQNLNPVKPHLFNSAITRSELQLRNDTPFTP